MKALLAAALILFTIFLSVPLSSQSPADSMAPPEKIEEREPSKIREFSGTITNLNVSQKRIAVRDAGREITFSTSQAKVEDGIKIGDRVKVMYREEGGRMLAEAVTLQR